MARCARPRTVGDMSTIVVGIDDSLRSQDAVALAADLARAGGAGVLAVCAYPFDDRPAAHFNPVMRGPLREAAEDTLERLCEPLSGLACIRRVPVADTSPARALLEAAKAADAALIVVASSHAGYHGRVCPGSTAWRLLQGSPYPVAIAPQGHRLRPHLSSGRVTVAFDGSPGARAALRAATPLAQAAGLTLRLTRVFAPETQTVPWLPAPPGLIRVTDNAERGARAELERAVAELPEAETAFLIGDPAHELALESEISDLLVIGSRDYGPAPAVLLGGVSGRLVETATCPVLIVPNGVADPLHGFVKTRGELLTGSGG
jgi:nucleotide-binding universal stress UspA family protein